MATEAVPFRDPRTEILAKLVATSPEDGLAASSSIRERKWQWARPQVEGSAPCARGGHTATLVGPTDPNKASARIFLFGGHYGGDSGSFIYSNEIYVLDIDENMWSQPRCRGTAPEKRYGHTSALVGTRIVFFGGKGDGQHFRDLHALDVASLTWYQGPSSGGAPSARHGHTATLQGNRLFVFGGVCGAKFFSDLHCLDLASMAWSAPEAAGPKPTARYGHCALLIGDSLLVHGGFSMETATIATKDNSGALLAACYCNDVRVLDLTRMLWSRLRTHGAPPTGRFGHAMVLSDDDILIVGGWAGQPKGNAAVAFSLKDKMRAEEGTQTNSEEEQQCDYCYTLRTADMEWMKNKYIGDPATRRYGHTATAIGPHLIVIGGWDGSKPLNDVVVLRDRTVGETAAPAPRVGQEAFDPEDGQQYEEDDDFLLETGEDNR